MSRRKAIRRVESADFTRNVASTLDAATITGRPIIVTYKGKPRVAIVPLVVELDAEDVARMAESVRRGAE